MPDVYAHYRFGRQVLSQFSPRQRQIIGRFRRLYDMGLYGADIFSFYNPFWQTQTGELPARYADLSAPEFLEAAKALAVTEGQQAYLCGLCAHHALTAACADIFEKVAQAGGSPAAAAAEFDRYLMELDGLAPDYDRSGRMKLTRGECVTAAQFFPPATAAQTHGAVRRMESFYRQLSGIRGGKKSLLLKILEKTPLKHRFPPTTPTREDIQRDSTLLVRYTRAIKELPQTLASQLP